MDSCHVLFSMVKWLCFSGKQVKDLCEPVAVRQRKDQTYLPAAEQGKVIGVS